MQRGTTTARVVAGAHAGWHDRRPASARVARADVADARMATARTAGFAAFAVPPGEDERFLAAWRVDGRADGVLYRALRTDARLRFVELAPSGSYAVVYEDGELEGEGGVLLIGRFAAGDDRLTAAWMEQRARFAPLRGYLGARLLAGDDVVGIVRWSSPLMHARAAASADVQAAARPLAAGPALYLPV